MDFIWYHAKDFTPEELAYYAANDQEPLTHEEFHSIDSERMESIFARASITFHRKAEKSARETFENDVEYRQYLASLQEYAWYAGMGIDTE